MTLTKEGLGFAVRDNCGFTRKRANELVNGVIDLVKDTLVNGEDVLISGFGKFYIKDKGKRRGRNPQTGEDLMLDSRRMVIFRCSEVLRDKMNGNR